MSNSCRFKWLFYLLCTLTGDLVLSAVPSLISYQGILKDSNGDPVNGTVDLAFGIYDDSTAGSRLWSESHQNVDVNNGLFQLLLGQFNPIADSVFSGPDRWLLIVVDNGQEVQPRTRIVSVPYAQRVSTVDGAAGGGISGDVTIASDLTVDGAIDATGSGSRIRFYFNTLADLPDANQYQGMFAHVHDEGRAYYAHGGQWVPLTDENNPHAVTGGDIVDGSIQLEDIGQNGAAQGQVIKWRSGSWIVDDDQTGNGGWLDDGTMVRLETDGDSVGIGTSSPTAKLDVAGNAIIGGFNTNSGLYSLVVGSNNNNSGEYSAIVGNGNTVSANWSAIAGGGFSSVSGIQSSVGGGSFNSVSGQGSSIGGGNSNFVAGDYSAIGSGRFNRVRGDFSVVCGGGGAGAADSNSANGDYSAVVGGRSNAVSAGLSNIGGGQFNSISGIGSVIAGGDHNSISNLSSVIGGGSTNSIAGRYSGIVGGYGNQCSAYYSTIAGGENDTIGPSAWYSMAFGQQVYIQNQNRVAFFDGINSGYATINRDDHDGTSNVPLMIGTVSGNGNGAYLSGGGVWTNASSRAFKEDGRPFEGSKLFDKISNLSIDTWQYKGSDEQHVGPYAEEFVAAFDVGIVREADGSRENRYLAAADVAGVALAGVKELIRENNELKELIYNLQEEIEKLKDNRE